MSDSARFVTLKSFYQFLFPGHKSIPDCCNRTQGMDYMVSYLIISFMLHILCNTKNVIIGEYSKTFFVYVYINSALMKEYDCSFISALLFVGAGLFLILLLFSFRCRLFLRFTVRIDNAFHCFTDRKLVQYTKARSYCLY